MGTDLKIGYLISQYPAVSHTFIQREIIALRNEGFEIHTASINEADIPSGQTRSGDKAEVDQTYYVKKQGVWIALGELFKSIIMSPLSLFKGIFYSQQLAKLNIKQMLYNLFYLAEALLIARWMKQKNIKHLHIHFANAASTVALILTKIHPYTYSITVHGPDEFYDVQLNNLKEKIENAAFIFCISCYARSQIMRLSGPEMWSKIDVVPLGVDPNIYLPNEFRKGPLPLRILCVGRMTRTKGQEILLQAVQWLISQGKQITLTYVGDGPERCYLKEKAVELSLQDSITFTGALNVDKTLEEFKKADVFTLLSFAEGVPVVLMEAMSMEIPCIATSVNGIPELIKNEINGILIPPSSVEEAIIAISRLLEDDSLRLKLGKAGRVTILEKYDLRANTKQLTKCFEKRLKRIL